MIIILNEEKTSVTIDFIRKAKEKDLKIHYIPNIFVYTKCTNSFLGFFKVKIKMERIRYILTFSYTYGSSFFLFCSILLRIYSLNIFLTILDIISTNTPSKFCIVGD